MISPQLILHSRAFICSPPASAIILYPCQQIIQRVEGNRNERVYLPYGVFTIASALLVGKILSTDKLIEQLYIDDPDGGADYANRVISASLHCARKALKPLGVEFKLVRHKLMEAVICDFP